MDRESSKIQTGSILANTTHSPSHNAQSLSIHQGIHHTLSHSQCPVSWSTKVWSPTIADIQNIRSKIPTIANVLMTWSGLDRELHDVSTHMPHSFRVLLHFSQFHQFLITYTPHIIIVGQRGQKKWMGTVRAARRWWIHMMCQAQIPPRYSKIDGAMPVTKKSWWEHAREKEG